LADGHIFDQNWGLIPEHDEDLIEKIQMDNQFVLTNEDDTWRTIKKCCPIISG
jgi:ribulose-bisphosphate carboxylase large chain